MLVVLSLCRYQNACHLCLRRLRIRMRSLLDILRIGVPAGLRGMLFGISNTMLQASVNSLGPAATSGNAAASSIEAFLYLTVAGFGQSAMVFTGQNYGAGYHRRIRRVMLCCLSLAAGSAVLLGGAFLLLREPLVALYLPDAPEAAVYAFQRMYAVNFFYLLLGIYEALSAVLQGLKISIAPTAAIILGICGLRLTWIFLAFPYEGLHSVYGLFLCYPISWAVTALALALFTAHAFARICPLSEEREGTATE